mgnify:CR=1 FL=1
MIEKYGDWIVYKPPLNKVNSNVSTSDVSAIEELVSKRKSGQIVIHPCDKTGGFGIMNRSDYVDSLQAQLHDTYTDADGDPAAGAVRAAYDTA